MKKTRTTKQTPKKSKTQSTAKKQNSKKSKVTPYLSWSRLSTIESSEKSYIENYIYGRKIKTKAMDFGTLVTDALEGRAETKDEIIQAVKTLVPSYKKGNVKFTAELKVGKEIVEVIGYMDGYEKNLIGEYKTSLYPWSFDKAYKHGQMILYSWAHWKNKKVIPEVELTWMETTKDPDDGEYYLTGNFLTHRFKYSLKELLQFEARMIKGYKKIKKVTEKELAL